MKVTETITVRLTPKEVAEIIRVKLSEKGYEISEVTPKLSRESDDFGGYSEVLTEYECVGTREIKP